MKHSEFRAFTESPIRLVLESNKEDQGLPIRGTVLENDSDGNNLLIQFSDQEPRIWTVKGLLPERYTERITLYFTSQPDPGNNAVTVYPVPLNKSVFLTTPQFIALDDQAVEDIQDRVEILSGASEEEICRWMAEEFIFDPLSPEEPPGLFIGVYAEESDYQRAGGFQIIGRSYVAGLRRTGDNKLLAEVFRKRTAKTPFLDLWKGKFMFTLDTQEAEIKSAAFQQEFQERQQDTLAFLNIWKEYLELDEKRLQSQLDKAGELVYHDFKAPEEGSRRRNFYLKKGEKQAAQKFFDVLKGFPKDEQIIEIEGRAGPGDSRQRLNFIEYDESSGTIVVEPDKSRKASGRIPKQGTLKLSLYGWQVANDRRRKAFDRIMAKQCGIRNLYYHLFEKPLPVIERRRTLQIRESEIRKAFGDDIPNGQQRTAVKVCLESPDIVLIQGPPGTGKTRVISALQNLLGQRTRKSQEPPSILLTSYQHDAVDNVAQKTRVFGLPAYRFGAKDRQQGEQGFLKWREDLAKHLREQLEKMESSPRRKSLRELKKKIIRLRHTRMPPASRLKFLQDTITGCKEDHEKLLKVETLHSLDYLAKKIQQAQQTASPDAGPIQQAIWAIRTTSEGYADDGTFNLQSLAAIIKAGIAVSADLSPFDLKLTDGLFSLADNAGDMTDKLLTELAELKILLLASLTKDPLWQVSNPLEDELRNTLDNAITDINDALQHIPEGRADIIEQFLEILESDSSAVKESISHYNWVYATTVQKTGAQLFLDIRSKHLQLSESNINGFDYVIIDEAARANPLDMFIPMSLARHKIVLVGDHMQLPHMLEPELEKNIREEGESAEKSYSDFKIEALRKSLFKRMWEYFQSRPDSKPHTVFLNTQYRMPPELGDFISRVFYEKEGNKIESPPPEENKFKHTVKRYKNKFCAWENCQGEEEPWGTGFLRPCEAKLTVDRAAEILKHSKESLGIITMYRSQKKYIEELLEKEGLMRGEEVIEKYSSRFRVGTVDSFQGREFDVVLLSPVRSNKYLAKSWEEAKGKFGFLTFENRLNVALSRQKKLLIVVGERGMYQTPEAQDYVAGLYEFNKMCQGS